MKTNITVLAVIALVFSTSLNAQNSIPNESERLQEIEEIFSVTEENICNPAFVTGKEWKQFKEDLTTKDALALDHSGFVALFNVKTKNLPFSHYELYSRLPETSKGTAVSAKTKKKPPTFELEKISEKTMLLHLRKFTKEVDLMKSIVKELESITYDNLIIDLRENTGGTMDAAIPLIQYFSEEMMHGGYFISRAWFEKHGDYPTDEQLELFTPLMDQTYEGFTKKMKEDMGMSLIVPPNGKSSFKGKIYLLTSNAYTASASEPFVFGLKLNKRAIVVGEKTVGAMLAGYNFNIANKYSLFMPLTDYITATNERLDRVGVSPDYETEAENALDYTLKLIEDDK